MEVSRARGALEAGAGGDQTEGGRRFAGEGMKKQGSWMNWKGA